MLTKRPGQFTQPGKNTGTHWRLGASQNWPRVFGETFLASAEIRTLDRHASAVVQSLFQPRATETRVIWRNATYGS